MIAKSKSDVIGIRILGMTFLLLLAFHNESLSQLNRETLADGVPIDSIPPPPPVPEGLEETEGLEEVFVVVEKMPRYPGCENQSLAEYELSTCATQKMNEFIFRHLVYPPEAKEKGIQGRAIAQFIVDSDGSIKNIKVVRSLGYGTDEAIINVLQSMPKWIPGYHKGNPVAVRFTVPFKFSFSAPEVKD